MSVLLETTAGDLVIDLDCERFRVESYNFLKLCKSGFYQYQCFYNLNRNYSVESGDALFGNEERQELRFHNTSVEGILDRDNSTPRLVRSSQALHQRTSEATFGAVGFLVSRNRDLVPLVGSLLVVSLAENTTRYDNAVFFGSVVQESHETLHRLNSYAVDGDKRPLVDVRIKKCHPLHDPFPDPQGLPTYAVTLPLRNVRLPPGLAGTGRESAGDAIERDIRNKELVLEAIGDIPSAGVKPLENVLFVCKLNPMTRAQDLAVIFHRFGEIVSVEIVRDKDTGGSLGYGFIEFSEQKACELAYSKMDGVLVDDRRIHVDFSQSVSRLADSWRRDRLQDVRD